MNRPDKPGELSIDEILASIRQNVSEAADAPPSGLDTVPEVSPPVVPVHAAPPPPPTAPPSLQTRLNGTSGNGLSAASPSVAGQNGAKRSLPFDQDLADILDEPDTASDATATLKPASQVAPVQVSRELGSSNAKPLSAPSNLVSPALTADAPSSPSSDAASSAALSSAPPVAPAPFGRGFGEGVDAPRAQSFGFPPLTKRTGFYPPDRPEPVLPPVRSDDLTKAAVPGAPLEAKDAPVAPALPDASASADRTSTNDPATRFPDFGSVVPSDIVGRGQPTADSSFGTAPRGAANGGATHAGLNGLSLRLPHLDQREPRAALDREALSPSLPTPASPLAPSPSVAEPVKTSFATKPDATPVAQETAGKDAAANALGALAQGLAASTAKSADAVDAGAASVQERPAAPTANPAAVAPVSAPASPAAAASPVPAQPASDAASASGRSLEDVVAEMLRPMLQKWVAENMPRIMEKALRSEMQRTLGPGAGTKPPGS